jgi:transposase-like protein
VEKVSIMANKQYSASFKFQVVLEALTSEKADAEVARAYDVHPVTLSKWKKQFKEDGSKVFGGDDELKKCEKKIADLERMVGKKEVEIAMLKNFLGDS